MRLTEKQERIIFDFVTDCANKIGNSNDYEIISHTLGNAWSHDYHEVCIKFTDTTKLTLKLEIPENLEVENE